MSGSGKSTILQNITINAIEKNRSEKVEVLAFEYEMIPAAQVIRTLSTKLKMSTEELMSKYDSLDKSVIQEAKRIADNMSKESIYYVDIPGRPEEMKETIYEFAELRKIKEENKCLLITVDFVSLCKGNASDSEKAIVDNLYKTILEVKKTFYDKGIKAIFVFLSQLNRDIESNDRKEQLSHYPNRNDIYAASSVYVNSDVVIIAHNPSVISGIEYYGPKYLPLYCMKTKRSFIYFHVIKNRGGKLAVFQMRENFNESKIEDVG